MMARPGATQVAITAAGELDYQLISRWTQSELGLGQGILGIKSGKRTILQKMLPLHFMMMPDRHSFSVFAPENTPLLHESQYK
jgi:hypothetical protein